MADRYLKIRVVRRGTRAGTATYAAAYRAGETIVDERTGNLYKFAWRQDVRHAEIVLPTGFSDPKFWARDRSTLWNTAERAERQRDARVAREYTVVFSDELTHSQRIELTRSFARFLADRYTIAVDFAIHEPRPGRATNHHAHLLTTTREIRRTGLGSKSMLDRQSPDYWRVGRTEQSRIRQNWMERLGGAVQRSGWIGRFREAINSGKGNSRDRSYRAGAAETSPLSWAEHGMRARKRGIDVEQLRRADRQLSKPTPAEQEQIRERRRAIRLRMEVLLVAKRERVNAIRRARRAARAPEQVDAQSRERRVRDSVRYHRPEVRQRELDRMRARYAQRSNGTVAHDSQRKRRNYLQNAENYRRLARERYQANIDVLRARRRAAYSRNTVAARLAADRRKLARQPVRVSDIQTQAIEQWRAFRAKQSLQPTATVDHRRDRGADYDYSR